MSTGIYASVGVTHLFTMRTTRHLRLLYLDGQSASLTDTESLDSQTALIRGSVPLYPGDEYIFDEHKRAEALCGFVDKLSIDGIVRMNAGFEVLLCNWVSAGVKVAISSNITVPGNEQRESDMDLPRNPNRTPPHGYGNVFTEQNSWEWIRSGVWHYGTSATSGGSILERRVKLDHCGILTFYNPALSSLKRSHHGGIRGNQTYENGWGLRRGHMLLDVSKDDISIVQSWVHQVTSHSSQSGFIGRSDSNTKCSGVDWQVITETIVDQHQTRALEILQFLIQGSQGSITADTTLRKIHELSHAIIYSYLEYPQSAGLSPLTVKQETIRRCASIYTESPDENTMNKFEFLIKDSIRLVMEKLCSWEWELFEWSESHTTNLLEFPVLPESPSTQPGSERLLNKIGKQAKAAEALVSWLGWDLWLNCEDRCSWNEFCYIPMWPVIYAPGEPQEGTYGRRNFTEKELYDFWKPKCIDRADFDRGGGHVRDPWHRLPDVPQKKASQE